MVEEPDCDDGLALLLGTSVRRSSGRRRRRASQSHEARAPLQVPPGQSCYHPSCGRDGNALGGSREEVEAEPLKAAEAVSERLGIVVVMKGSETFVVSPLGTWCYEGGAVGLATSGSGDVLAGIVTGLAARGASATDAAIWGVFLHGEAGAELSKKIGPLGFLAREIPACIPRLLLVQAPAGEQ